MDNKIVESLNKLLADLAVFYRKLQNYHWNVVGKQFFVAHEKLEEYYDCVAKEIDEVAEQILALGYQPLGTLQDYLDNTKISEATNKKVTSKEIIPILVKDIETLLKKFTEIKEHAEEEKVYITNTLMDEYITSYSKKLWMVKQLEN